MSQKGVLLVNLGSPDSPSVPDVRRYLREFLMDGRVLDAPYPIRFCVVNFTILPSRPKESAAAYQTIWTPEGSPLVVTSKRVQAELQRRVDVPVGLAMRYQNPSIPSAIDALASQGVDELLLIPLFPHYAMSSFETAVERVKEVIAKRAPGMSLQVVPPYYQDADYIEALVASAADYLAAGYDHLLFSFHGLPERHMRKADLTGAHCMRSEDCCKKAPPNVLATCYRAQCYKTVDAFVRKAGVTRCSVAFQSRLGREPWLRPYTDEELVRLAREGVQKLLVICPAFVSDCLETLEEIGGRGQESFHHAGGKTLQLIPCMNEHPRWLAALETMVKKFVGANPASGKAASRQLASA